MSYGATPGVGFRLLKPGSRVGRSSTAAL
ncbi:unnamed protein product, partial [Rotaria sp. Silwood2]